MIILSMREGRKERTRATASLEAMIMMSAQETTPGQSFSSACLTWSTTLYDLSEFIFERAIFSPSIVAVSSSNIDPSHPFTNQIQIQIKSNSIQFKSIQLLAPTFTKQSWNWKRMTEATLLASLIRAFFITSRTMTSAFGHVFE